MMLRGETEVLAEQDAQRTCLLTLPEHCAQRNDSEPLIKLTSSLSMYKNLNTQRSKKQGKLSVQRAARNALF
jgi:hypothetical protein